MALKNHTLDSRITDAALQEFLNHGYEKASLRKIAAQAEVTVGAIYTRYATKDALFCALAAPLIRRIEEAFSAIRTDYHTESPVLSPACMADSMQKESAAILHLLFDDYDRAVLLLCRSAGSSLEHFFDEIVQRKIDETLLFFRNAGCTQIGPGTLKLLIQAQFHMYAQIIREGYPLETAREIMDAAMRYHTGGWLALLEGSAEQ